MDRTEIGNKLIESGIYPSLKGFEYLISAVLKHKPGESMMSTYSIVADLHNESAARVERCIRHAKGKSEAYKNFDNSTAITLIKWELEAKEAKA